MYIFVKRNLRYPMFEAFDFPNTARKLRAPLRHGDPIATAGADERRAGAGVVAGARRPRA